MTLQSPASLISRHIQGGRLAAPGHERPAVQLDNAQHAIDLLRRESAGKEEAGRRLLVPRAAEGPHRHVGARDRHAGPDLRQGRVRRFEIRKARADDVHASRLTPTGGPAAFAIRVEAFGSVTATPTARRLQWNRARTIGSVTTLDGEARGRIFALVPAHDEAPKIARVVEGAGRHVPVVLVVDDGSADETATLAENAGARVLRQSPNQGKGAALRAGFAAALASGAEAVITLDGDGQHDPAELPSFLGAYARRTIAGEPSELIVGQRSFSRMPLARRLANGLGTVVLSAALGRWIADNQSGYRLIGRRLMTAMLDSREDGFAFEVEMIAVCLREGWPIDWVPVRTIYADERSHIEPMRHLREFLGVTRRARHVAGGPRTVAAGVTHRPGVEPTPEVEG